VINARRVIGGRRQIRRIMIDAGNMTGKHRGGVSAGEIGDRMSAGLLHLKGALPDIDYLQYIVHQAAHNIRQFVTSGMLRWCMGAVRSTVSGCVCFGTYPCTISCVVFSLIFFCSTLCKENGGFHILMRLQILEASPLTPILLNQRRSLCFGSECTSCKSGKRNSGQSITANFNM
jgi:hypothetical protein